MAALEVAVNVNPFESDVPIGTVIPSVSAVGWQVGARNCDIRPRLLDKSSGQFRLIDSGSMITATSKLPGDKPDENIKIIAVNGTKINTYGIREIDIKIGRKKYTMPAVVCDIKQDILGMDFLDRFKLNLMWNEDDESELLIVDRKAQIRAPLTIITVPTDTQRIHYMESGELTQAQSLSETSIPGQYQTSSTLSDTPSSGLSKKTSLAPEEVAFQISCMKQLDSEVGSKEKSEEEALKSHDPFYASLIKKYPQLLNPHFVKGEPIHGVWHKIETGSNSPCKAKRRPILANTAKAEAGRKAWEKMERDGIIERVKAGANTEWTSALHIADKAGPGASARPCSDFRDLNSKTECDNYPLPLLRDFTSRIHGAKYFSVVDLRSAFFNVPIWPEHRHKTTTLSPWGGAFIYNRMAFGLASGPSTWQRLLETVLKDVKNIFCYLDDVLIWGNSKKDHDETLEEVFKKLAENNLALSVDKCKFGQSKVDYLGYSVSTSGIKPLPKKLAALDQFKNPQSQKDVLHFCGALNYFRSSLKGIKRGQTWKSAAAVLQPLYAVGTDQIPKGVKFQEIWSNSESLQTAFAEAKEMLRNAVELYHPNPNYPVMLFTDASDHSVGGSLQMLDPNGQFHPLGFYSAHLNDTQKKYSTFKKELLGAHKSLRHFLPEVYGKHLTIYTDCLPLQQAFKSNSIPLNDPQTYRQITEIGQFTRDVKHVSGVNNVFADYLSRIKDEERGTAYLEHDPMPTEVAAAESLKLQIMSISALHDLQAECPDIKKILSGDKPKNTSFDYVEIDGKSIFCEITSHPRPYVPYPLRQHLISSLHFDHLGIKSMIKRVAGEFYWPSLQNDVKLFGKTCNSCMKTKPNKQLVNTGQFSVPDKRFSHVMVDVVGPLPPSYGHKFLLTMICRTTRLCHAAALTEASSSAISTAFLTSWVQNYGLPALVTSDNGSSFLSGMWKGMMSKLNINVRYSALYRPQSIGLLERQHRSIKDSLKAAIEDTVDKHQDRWLDFLPFVLLGRKVALQPDIGASASELSFGMNLRIPGQILHDPGELPDGPQLQDILRDVRKNTSNDAKQTSRHNKEEKLLNNLPPEVTHVYTRQHQTKGLQTPFEGPFRIESRLSRSTVRLEVGTYKDGSKRYEVRHINDLKLAHPSSMAAPASRPALGRPPTSPASSTPTTSESTSSNQHPRPTTGSREVDKQSLVSGKIQNNSHPISNQNPRVHSESGEVEVQGETRNSSILPSLNPTGPPSNHPFPTRAARSTRNPSPNYVSSIWSASENDIALLNKQIQGDGRSA